MIHLSASRVGGEGRGSALLGVVPTCRGGGAWRRCQPAGEGLVNVYIQPGSEHTITLSSTALAHTYPTPTHTHPPIPPTQADVGILAGPFKDINLNVSLAVNMQA